MSIHKSFITQSKKTNICNEIGESKTDKSQFRPDIASVRDKAIAMQASGQGRTGIYDENLTDEEMLVMAYARNAKRDITELESAKQALKQTINAEKKLDKKKLKDKAETKELRETMKKIAKNTEPKNEKTALNTEV